MATAIKYSRLNDNAPKFALDLFTSGSQQPCCLLRQETYTRSVLVKPNHDLYIHFLLHLYQRSSFYCFPKLKKRQNRVFLLSYWIWIGMVLPVVKLGTLVLKTLSKPLASRLKHQAAVHPRFRQFIINLAQVLIYALLISFYQLGLAWI